jgi:hypothetical protein
VGGHTSRLSHLEVKPTGLTKRLAIVIPTHAPTPTRDMRWLLLLMPPNSRDTSSDYKRDQTVENRKELKPYRCLALVRAK